MTSSYSISYFNLSGSFFRERLPKRFNSFLEGHGFPVNRLFGQSLISIGGIGLPVAFSLLLLAMFGLIVFFCPFFICCFFLVRFAAFFSCGVQLGADRICAQIILDAFFTSIVMSISDMFSGLGQSVKIIKRFCFKTYTTLLSHKHSLSVDLVQNTIFRKPMQGVLS